MAPGLFREPDSDNAQYLYANYTSILETYTQTDHIT